MLQAMGEQFFLETYLFGFMQVIGGVLDRARKFIIRNNFTIFYNIFDNLIDNGSDIRERMKEKIGFY